MTNIFTKKTILFLLGTLLYVSLSAQTFGGKALNYYLQGENAFANQDYTQAFQLYQQALASDSTYDPAMFQIARVYLYQNQIDKALTWAEKAYQLDKTNSWYGLLLIDLYKHFGKPKEAISVYQNLLLKDSTNTDYLENLAVLYAHELDNTDAIATYNKLEKQKGISEAISFAKRDLYMNLDDFDKAVQEMIKLSTNFPDKSQYLSMIAEMYMGHKEPDKAFLFYQKVLDVNPEDPYIRITLADYYQQKGEIDLAFENLEQGYLNPKLDLDTKIQILTGLLKIKHIPEAKTRAEALKLANSLTKVHPNKPGSHAIYADLLYRDSLYSDAAREYENVLKIDSSRYAVWEQLLFSLNNKSETKKIVSMSQRAIKLFPNEPIPYLFNAIGYFIQDSTKKAIQSLQKGLPLANNSKLIEQFYMYLGDAYYQDKQSEKAFEAYDHCLKINPSNTFVLNNYAYYLALKKQRLDKAKTMAFSAVHLDPQPTNQDTYGWVLYQLGDYQQAFEYIDKAVKGDPNPSAEVLDHMGDVYFRLGNPKKAKKFWRKAHKAGLNTTEFKNKLVNGL
jgi:tetratricopeptide (TPR) repeat protein